MIHASIIIAAALSQAAVQAEPDAQNAIRQLEAAWTKATVEKDMAALDRLMSPEFALTFGAAPEEGVPRGPWLANLQRMTISDYKVAVVGVDVMGDVAVASIKGSWNVRLGDRTRSEPFTLKDVWLRKDGRWQVYRRHRSE